MDSPVRKNWKHDFRAIRFFIGGFGLVICLILVSTGCNQRRYKPAAWRPAARDNSTLPDVNDRPANGPRWSDLQGANGTMPARMYSGTLPNRGTLPARGFGGTLPQRSWSTMPGRGSFQPGRGFPVQNGQRWSTLPSRGGLGGGTLPNRQLYPEYRTPQRNGSTLPSNSRWTPQTDFPLPNQTGSTMPQRNPRR